MNRSLKIFIQRMPNEAADRALVAMACDSMSEKLTRKRNQGRHGWHNNCRNNQLLVMLKRHVEKGDMVDVMNLAAMIHARTELYGEDA